MQQGPTALLPTALLPTDYHWQPILAIGIENVNSEGAQVRVFHWSATKSMWEQKGAKIDADVELARFKETV